MTNKSEITHLLAGLASGIIVGLGLMAAQVAEQRDTLYNIEQDTAEVLVGLGCDDEGENADFVIVAYEEDEFPWPCKSVERHRLTLRD